ncbi:uncharacterized protein [Setaria viridis]|uniref:uncharacterized protein n=1 Tax=Setaria viridis TaxID=4556 RepID=UPI001493B5BF|nr:uncharacterized protein LOC117834350 [Setaria viridis]
MVAYCNEVHKLEEKFDGLELNHVARHFNEAADELAKAASGRKHVPDGMFISNQCKPSIRYKESGGVGDAPPVADSGADPGKVGNSPPVLDPGVDPSDPKVMEIDTNPAEGHDPSDWRAPYLDYLIHELLPTDKMEVRRIARRAKSFVGKLCARSATENISTSLILRAGTLRHFTSRGRWRTSLAVDRQE